MSELEERAVIKFLWKEGYFAKRIDEKLEGAYGDAVYAFSSVYFWAKEFKWV
jgi:hypothetical protein